MKLVLFMLLVVALAGCGDGSDEAPGTCEHQLNVCQLSLNSCLSGK